MDIKINTILESMEEYIESKPSVAMTKRIFVNKNEILEYIKNIRTELPKSLSHATMIYEDREKILEDAASRAEENIRISENKAQAILDEANATARSLVEENEITRKAKLRAQEIIDNAEAEARRIMNECVAETENMRKETFDFVEEKLGKLENTFAHAKYNVDYLKEEFEKNGASLFHILNSNIDKEFEAVQGNKSAFVSFRDSLNASKNASEGGEA